MLFFQNNVNIPHPTPPNYLNDLHLASCNVASCNYRSVMLSYLQDLPAHRGDLQNIYQPVGYRFWPTGLDPGWEIYLQVNISPEEAFCWANLASVWDSPWRMVWEISPLGSPTMWRCSDASEPGRAPEYIFSPAYICVMGFKSMECMAFWHKLWIKWSRESVFMSHLCYLPTVWTWAIPVISPFTLEWRYWTRIPICSVVHIDFTLMPAHQSRTKNLRIFWTVEVQGLLSVEMWHHSAVSPQRWNFSGLHKIHIFGSWVLWRKNMWGWVFSVLFHLTVILIWSREIGSFLNGEPPSVPWKGIWKPASWGDLCALCPASLTRQIATSLCRSGQILSLFMHLFTTKELAWIYSFLWGRVSRAFH